MNWKSRLACYDMTSDLWQIVHFMILLELSESNIQTNEILTELTILTHSQAAQLYSLMHFNGIVRELLYKYNLSLLQVQSNNFIEFEINNYPFFMIT